MAALVIEYLKVRFFFLILGEKWNCFSHKRFHEKRASGHDVSSYSGSGPVSVDRPLNVVLFVSITIIISSVVLFSGLEQ